MKLNRKITFIVLTVIVLIVLICVYLLLLTSPGWLVYSLALLLALSGIWQVSQVKAVLIDDEKDTATKSVPTSKRYWLKRIGLFCIFVIMGVLAESAWWTKQNNLPLSYTLKKPLWQFGLSTSPSLTPLPELKKIPAGTFEMGSNDYDNEKPIHTVNVSQPFLMAKTEITFEHYDYYIWDLHQQGITSISYLDTEGKEASQPINYPDDEGWGRDNRPVINISWYEAQGYAYWLSKQRF